jgi:L-2,4-diaminobutyric acid acetyltransferase
MHPAKPEPERSPLTIRTAMPDDSLAMWRLARDSGGLELNTPYAFALLASHFRRTSLVAEEGGKPVAFVAAYRPPTHPESVFVWQIAVGPEHRGRGIASELLRALVRAPACRTVRHLEATVTPSNRASRRLFEGFARSLGVPCEVGPGYDGAQLGEGGHEDEALFRIGPITERSG